MEYLTELLKERKTNLNLRYELCLWGRGREGRRCFCHNRREDGLARSTELGYKEDPRLRELATRSQREPGCGTHAT